MDNRICITVDAIEIIQNLGSGWHGSQRGYKCASPLAVETAVTVTVLSRDGSKWKGDAIITAVTSTVNVGFFICDFNFYGTSALIKETLT